MALFSNPEYNQILNECSPENKCIICSDKLTLGAITLECGHKYHVNCLKLSFNKYEAKKCPYCSVKINFNKYKKKCIQVKRNGEVCGKNCLTDSSLCSYHINLKLKKMAKESSKNEVNLKSEMKKTKRSINTIKNKINKLLKSLSEKMTVYKKLIDESNRIKNEI